MSAPRKTKNLKRSLRAPKLCLGVLEALNQIGAGRLDPSSLSIESRREIVQYLSARGRDAPEIAQILRVHERTIHRDRKAIREANALEPDPQFTAMMLGQLMSEAEAAAQPLRRISSDPRATHQDVINARKAIWKIHHELAALLHRLGYLPDAFNGATPPGEANGSTQLPTAAELYDAFAGLEPLVKPDSAQRRQLLKAIRACKNQAQRMDLQLREAQLRRKLGE